MDKQKSKIQDKTKTTVEDHKEKSVWDIKPSHQTDPKVCHDILNLFFLLSIYMNWLRLSVFRTQTS